MNILFITSFRISTNSGGVQRVTETLAKEFIRKGHKVYYLSFTKGEKEVIEGVNQYYLPNGTIYDDAKNITYFKELIEKNNIGYIINQIGFSKKVLRFIKNNINKEVKIFSVHHNCLKCLNDQYHNIYASTLKSKGLYKLFNNKIGWDLLKKIHKYRFSKEINETIKLSDKVVLLSDKFISDIGFYLPNFDKNKIIGLPNPNPFEKVEIDFNKKENRIVFVGRLSIVQKRVERLIEIWESIYFEFPNWEFDIVGDGPDRNQVENIVKEKGLKRINFHGFQDPKPFLNNAKIFLMTSDFEGFGMVLIEAQTYGVVPVTFECFSSIYDIIDNGETGIVIKEFNTNNYISKLKHLMANDKELKIMSLNAIEHVKTYEASKIIKKWINLFNTLNKFE